MVMATVAATQITVRTRMPGRFAFVNTWLKLLSPADPIVMPSGVMSWNDVWTIVTIGHRTTTAIRAIAGPIQSSGSRAASLRRLDGPGGLRADPRVDVLGFGASGIARAQPPLLAVCWIAPRICAGLPVMAWPTWVLIMFSTDVQFA